MPMNNKVSSDLVIQGNFDQPSHSKGSGGLLEFTIPGRFIHFNTIEEYQAFDFAKFKYFEKPYPVNTFVMVCFGDLKNYNFYYKVALFQYTQ